MAVRSRHPENPRVYIGETENAFNRLKQHVEKDFWNEAVVFISKDENLNKAHVKFLESVFHEKAVSASRFCVENSTSPTRSSISEADQAEMGEFAGNAQLLLNTMGFKVFEAMVRRREPEMLDEKDEEIFHLKGKGGAVATGIRSSEGFIVLKGAHARKETVASFERQENRGDRRKREDLLSSGVFEDTGDTYLITDDVLCSSPTSAACIVLGRNASGPAEWKTVLGKTLKEIEEAEIGFPS